MTKSGKIHLHGEEPLISDGEAGQVVETLCATIHPLGTVVSIPQYQAWIKARKTNTIFCKHCLREL